MKNFNLKISDENPLVRIIFLNLKNTVLSNKMEVKTNSWRKYYVVPYR